MLGYTNLHCSHSFSFDLFFGGGALPIMPLALAPDPEAAPRGGLGGRVHPTFFKNRFCDSPKFDEKMGGGGNQSFSFSS